MTTATFSPTAVAAPRNDFRHTPRVTETPEYVITVIGGQVVTTPRNRVTVGADGELTIPCMDD